MNRTRLINIAKKIIPPLITLLIIVLLLQQISLQDLLALLTNLSYTWLFVGVGFYGLTNLCRAMRLQRLLPNRSTRLPTLVVIAIAQSMFNNTLPARTGELSLVYLLYKYEAVPVNEATIALIMARLLDYFAVAIIFIAAALLSLSTLPANVTTIIMTVVGVMLLSLVALLILVGLRWRGLAVIRAGLQWLGWQDHRWSQFGLKKVAQIIVAFEAIHSLKQYLLVFSWSLLTWLATFLWFYAFIHSVAIEVELLTMIVGATFAVLSKAIPFISIGGLGAHEAGWTVGFVLIGWETALAISSGFVVNILTLISSVMLGLPGLLILRYVTKQPERDMIAET